MTQDINQYDILYAQALFGDIRVSAATYDKIVDNIKNNPDKYPWEHALNSYPKETIDSYIDEITPEKDISKNNTPAIGLMELVKEAKPIEFDTSKSLSERQLDEADKAKLKKEREKRIWNKYFDIAHDGGLFIIF